MKKSIVYLGLALVVFTNFSFTTNETLLLKSKPQDSFIQEVSPLCIAVSKGDLDLVKKIIEYGIDLNEESNGMTPLMFAARYNKLEVLKYLISRGAQVRTTDSKGFNALKYAKLSNAFDVIEYLKKI